MPSLCTKCKTKIGLKLTALEYGILVSLWTKHSCALCIKEEPSIMTCFAGEALKTWTCQDCGCEEF